MFETPEYIQQFIEEKLFEISQFSKINENKINSCAEILILPMTNEIFIYSTKNIINIYKYDKKIFEIEEKEGNIKYLYCVFDNKFLYLTDGGSLKIYTFDIYGYKLINNIILKNPRKVISSYENNSIYVLGNDIRKLKIQIEIEQEIIQSIPKEIQISSFSDILEIRKNIIILSSSKNCCLVWMDEENKKINNFSQKIFPVEKNNLYKLNDNEFLIIEKSKIKKFSLINDFELKQTFDYNRPFSLLYFINEEKILIRDEIKKHVVKQINLLNLKESEENSLRISIAPHEIEQIELMKNRRYFIVLIKNITKVFLSSKEEYNIEIWGIKKPDKFNSYCPII